MKKIVLLVGLLVCGSFAYGSPQAGIQGKMGVRYGVSSSTVVYYPIDFAIKNAKMTCLSSESNYKPQDISFEVISDNLFWSGSQAGVYTLNAANNYNVTVIFKDIRPDSNNMGGNVIFISKTNSRAFFILQCNLTS